MKRAKARPSPASRPRTSSSSAALGEPGRLGGGLEVGAGDPAEGQFLPQVPALRRVGEVEGDLTVVEAVVVGEAAELQHVHELVQQVGQAGGLDDERGTAGVAVAAAADQVIVAGVDDDLTAHVLEDAGGEGQQRARGVGVAGLEVHAYLMLFTQLISKQSLSSASFMPLSGICPPPPPGALACWPRIL